MPEHMLHLTEPAFAQVGKGLEAQRLTGRLLTNGSDGAKKRALGDSLEALLSSARGGRHLAGHTRDQGGEAVVCVIKDGQTVVNPSTRISAGFAYPGIDKENKNRHN